MDLKTILQSNGKTTSINPETVVEVKQTREADLLHDLTIGLLGDGPETTIRTNNGDRYVMDGTPTDAKNALK